MGVESGQAKLEDIDAPMAGFADTLEKVAAGEKPLMSWRALISGKKPSILETRRFIEVQPRLDFDALEPGKEASDAIRKFARDLNFTPESGVSVRLTGPVPLSDEEFATISENAVLMTTVMLGLVLLTLWLAVKSFRIIFAIFVTLFAGLAITMAFGLMAVGVFNIISIAFIALFVGLGVDFGIQFSVRYRAERHTHPHLAIALTHAGREVGMPLFLAAAATAVGFFSFLPTYYVGVAELGLIAGVGMIIAFILSITMLPSLLMLLNPPGEEAEVGYAFFAPIEGFMTRHRKQVLIAAGVLAVLSLALVPFIRFDSDPLHLRSPKVESMATLNDLMKVPETSPNVIDVLAPNLEEANKIASRLSALPEVGQVLTLSSYVPVDQNAKLTIITDAATLLDTTLAPFDVRPPPSDGEVVEAFRNSAARLRQVAGSAQGKPADDARRLAAALEKLASGPREHRAHAYEAMIPGLNTLLRQLSSMLQAGPVTTTNMPPDMIRDWIAKDGRARVQVSPKDVSGDPDVLTKFTEAVLKIAPDATGAPISIRKSGATIVGAFIQAGIWSFIAITILLFVFLRRAREVVFTIAPLALTGLVTLATCVVIGMDLNFANVIALPLLLGIGVAFNVYFVVAWWAGERRLLQSALTRAVIFSSATTASGFGSLWLSSHPGTASMGALLMISLAWTLVTTLFLSPALLGPGPTPQD
jgi:hopanoid biosynthesis associated RND transporter like protein HpnN